MVHFPGFARTRLWIHRAVLGFCPSGFPHSEISGSMPACGSPKLIAACHVLHRLLLPRHPPCALSSLTTKFTRHTQESPSPSAFGRQLKTIPNTPFKSYGPSCLLIARQTPIRVFAPQQAKIQALIKIYTPCNFAQSIQLSKIVLVKPAVRPSASGLVPLTPPQRVWVLLNPECANSRSPPTQCSAPGDFH
jgi:hypothetical protein